MRTRNLVLLLLIVLLVAIATYIALPVAKPTWITNRIAWQDPVNALSLRLGLDLQGGTQVQLEAQPPADRGLEQKDIDTAKTIIDRRVNGLGVAEALVQTSGERIIVALPGVEDADQAIDTLRSTGQLEFVEFLDQFIEPGTKVVTSLSASDVPTDTVVYPTIMTGDKLRLVDTATDPTTNEIVINFQLTDEGKDTFGDYTSAHVGDVLGIVMDKTVLSAPRINTAITEGEGQITGDFTLEEARNLAIQMQYGALPVALNIADVRTVGPSLGQDSVESSITAGIIGIAIVLLFMLVYYRLPGFLADLALLSYAVLNLMVYKLLPVTLTLPGIAGFLLSTGMAVDANILIFERMKEELRGGKSLPNAVESGFARAWTSILDSNLSTLITCVILYYFGSNFGASIVQGFAITLGIGVLISMFTAVVVTRTLMRFVVDTFGAFLSRHLALFGA